jgi:HEAT repeat protein
MKKAIVVMMALAAGCGSHQQSSVPRASSMGAGPTDTRMGAIEPDLNAKPHNPPKPPAPPPAVPARQAVTLNPALRDAAKKELASAFQSNDPVIRANSIEAMQDTLGESASAQIIHGLDDPDPLVRFASCMAVGKLKLRAAYPTVSQLAVEREDNVKVGAIFALHRLGDKRRTNQLEKLATNGFPSVRGNVAIVLGMIEEPTAVNVLHGMEHDSEPTVRLQVYEALWRLGDSDGLNSLVAGTLSSFPDDQIICVLALAQTHDSRVRPHIYGKLTSEYFEIALVAARALGMIGSDEGYGVALKGVKSADPRQKALGALALGQIGRADAQDILGPMLKDPNAPVRLAAATALLQLKA